MKKIITLLAMLAICCAQSSAQILYKISGNGLSKPSYIVGTCHTISTSFADSIPGLDGVLQSIEQVCGELDLKYSACRDTVEAMGKYFLLPDGKSIPDYATQQQMEALSKAVKENFGIDLSRSEYSGLLNFHPNIFQVLLMQIHEMSKGKPAQDSEIFDKYFQNYANSKGLPTMGLETYTEQARMIAETDEPMSQLIDEIIDYLESKDESESMMASIISAYRRMDLGEIGLLVEKAFSESKDWETRLLAERNQNWVEKMPRIMESKPTLFAVGAAHIAGEKSVLNLLSRYGYEIDAVE